MFFDPLGMPFCQNENAPSPGRSIAMEIHTSFIAVNGPARAVLFGLQIDGQHGHARAFRQIQTEALKNYGF
jgi:hypothetical protein